MTQSAPPIFIMKTAEEGALLERNAIIATLNRWADGLEHGDSCGMTTSQRLRRVARVIGRGEHHRPIDTAPRRRMGR